MLRLLYPCDPFKKTAPDEDYADEFNAAIAAGLSCSLFSLEDFDAHKFQAKPKFDAFDRVLYRGWMQSPANYSRLVDAIEFCGAAAITSASEYAHCHYLPNWYESCAAFTPRTIFASRDSNFQDLLTKLNWKGYFIKDFVKSLTTTRGSVAANAFEVSEIISAIEKYRGQIDGGICIREFEDLLPESEERYFVVRGNVFARDDEIPGLVGDIAQRILSPFFSVDIARRSDGTLRLIELGDGQVSDRKKWESKKFISMLEKVSG